MTNEESAKLVGEHLGRHGVAVYRSSAAPINKRYSVGLQNESEPRGQGSCWEDALRAAGIDPFPDSDRKLKDMY